jgi:hypothetical protein
MALFFQNSTHELAHRWIIIDHQNGEYVRRVRRVLSVLI